jgi:hypothetical protein
MRNPPDTLRRLILDQLAHGEMRLLTLLVAIRKTFGPPAHFKGDLSAVVKAALRKLEASKMVVNTDGVYTLCAPVESHA